MRKEASSEEERDASGPGVTPGVNRALPPKFSEMEANPFEEMTCALVDKIEGVTRADLYHVQRRKQFGVDIFGETASGLIVASCKCYASVKKDQVAEWTQDFLKHWDTHWYSLHVIKFILVVAAPMHSQERLADISIARTAFAAKGIAFDVWAPRQLQERLRSQPGIVSEYLGPEWIERLCGKSGDFSSAAASEAPGADANLREQLSVLIKAVSGETERKLEAARRSLDRGQIGDVEATLLALRADSVWSSIEARVQAQAVRLQASLALERGDLDAAEAFAVEADSIAPAEEPRLKALLTLRREGPKRGLEILGEPTSDAGRRLAAAMHLELGDVGRAESMLAEIKQDADYHRLRAYVALFQGDAQGALEAAHAAEALDRDLVGVIRVGAIARYASALTPIAGALHMVQPQPIGRMFVRADDEARERLAESVAALERLAALEADPKFKASDDLWRLACLCNLEGRVSDAEALASSMLVVDAMNVPVIGWGVSRNLTFNRAHSLAALRAAFEDGSITSDGVRALEWLWPDESIEELADLMRSGRAGATFRDAGKAREIEALLERLHGGGGDNVARVQWATVEAARKSGDWSAVEALFDRLSAQGGFEPALLFLGEELMGADRATFVFDRRQSILAFATAEATRLAIYAAINADEPQVALDLMEQNVSLFAGGRLPYDLRRVETAALSALGDAPRALAKAAALAAESDALSDKLLEANVRISMGDLGGAASAVRLALAREDFAPQTALHYADRFASADPDLARSLWRRAVANALDDRLSLAAIGIAFRLGVEHERPDLFGAMHRLAAHNDAAVRVASFDEFVEEFKEGKKREEELNRYYRIGAAPVHSVLAAANGDLAALYELKAEPGAHAVLLRHGARPLEVDFGNIDAWRIRMDVTALLVADALDLFDLLESLPQPIALGHNLPVLLASLEQKTQFHQPSRVIAARRVLKAIADREIDQEPAPPESVAVVLDVADHAGPATNLAAVLRALERAGAISAFDADALARLESWSKPDGVAVEPGALLVFEDHGLESAADAGVLDAVTRTFKVYANADAIQPCRDLYAAAEAGDGRAARMAALRARLNAGIAGGAYRLLPARRAEGDEDEATSKALHEQLFSVMGNTSQGEMVWVDDRYVSGYPNVDRGFLIGVTDVLAGLRLSGRLDEQGYFDRLARLRGAGALFIPVTAAEVQYHLRAAPVINNVVTETPGLAALRRNFALTVLNEDNLKTSDIEPALEGRPVEIQFLAENRKLAGNAVLEAWRDEPDLARAKAHANWIWGTLRTDHAKFDASGGSGFGAILIAGLAASALFLNQAKAEPRLTRLRSFMDWLGKEVIGLRFTRDPVLAQEVARGVRLYLLSALGGVEEGRREPKFRKAVAPLVRRLVALLPETLRLDVLSDEDFRREIGFKGELVITLDDVQVAPRRLWRAAQNAVRHGHARFWTARRKKVRVKVRPNTRRSLRFDGALKGALHEPALAFLERDAPEVRVEIGELLAACDVPPSSRDALAEAWRKIDPGSRMEAYHQRRASAVSVYLHDLYEKLSKGQSIDIDSFTPPPPSAWLDFLRWPHDEAEGELATAIAELTGELGAETAFERMSCAPIRLPQSLLAAVKQDAQNWASPLHALHGMAAMGQQDLGAPDLNGGADELAEICTNHGPLFLTLLNWVSYHFDARDDWRDLSAAARSRVLWTAADQLTRVLVRAGADPEFTRRFFEGLKVDRPILPTLDLLSGYHDSPLDPRYLRIEPLLLFGLMNALNDGQWTAVMSDNRQTSWLERFGMEDESGKKSLRPMRSFNGAKNWFDNPAWRERSVTGATDGDALLNDALAKLENEPSNRDAWVSVGAFGLPAVATDVGGRISAVATRANLPVILGNDEKFLAIRLIAEAVSRLGRSREADTFLRELIGVARAQHTAGARLKVQGGDADDLALALLESALLGARSFERGVGLPRLTDFVSKFVTAWPASAPAVRRIFEGLIEQTPAARAAPLWRPLWAARLL